MQKEMDQMVTEYLITATVITTKKETTFDDKMQILFVLRNLRVICIWQKFFLWFPTHSHAMRFRYEYVFVVFVTISCSGYCYFSFVCSFVFFSLFFTFMDDLFVFIFIGIPFHKFFLGERKQHITAIHSISFVNLFSRAS